MGQKETVIISIVYLISALAAIIGFLSHETQIAAFSSLCNATLALRVHYTKIKDGIKK